MSDIRKASVISALESVTTFMKILESDFRRNKLYHLDQIRAINKGFKDILNSPTILSDEEGELGPRIDNLHASMLSLSSAVKQKVSGHILFSNRAVEEISCLFSETEGFLKTCLDFLTTNNSILLGWLENKQNECRKYCDSCATSHEERLVEGICVPTASLIFLDMLRGFNGIYWQTINAVRLLDQLYTPEKVSCGGS